MHIACDFFIKNILRLRVAVGRITVGSVRDENSSVHDAVLCAMVRPLQGFQAGKLSPRLKFGSPTHPPLCNVMIQEIIGPYGCSTVVLIGITCRVLSGPITDSFGVDANAKLVHMLWLAIGSN